MRKYAEFYQQAGPCPKGIPKQFDSIFKMAMINKASNK
jgi:hypothetical protein